LVFGLQPTVYPNRSTWPLPWQPGTQAVLSVSQLCNTAHLAQSDLLRPFAQLNSPPFAQLNRPFSEGFALLPDYSNSTAAIRIVVANKKRENQLLTILYQQSQ
jgi:hypothetical protein